MTRPVAIIFAFACSSIACARGAPPNPNGMAVVLEPYDEERAAWYIEHCRLVVAAEDSLPRIAPLDGANHALVHSTSRAGVRAAWFRCEERPPWPRADAAEVRTLYDELERTRGFACIRPYVPYGAPPTEVTVVSAGGEPIRDDQFVHARLRNVA